MKHFKLKLLLVFLLWNSTVFSAGYADAYFYKAKPGKYEEAADLMREGRDIGLANGQVVIVHQQNIGKGGEKMFLWVDFFNTYEDRARAYTAEAWQPFLEKFNQQTILMPVKSYQMTSLDEINPPIGIPPPNAFPTVSTSGTTLKCSKAKSFPVLPKPD